MNMSQRQQAILQTIVEIYSKTGEPVSSKLLSGRLGFQVSPATIRAEMAWLFDMGYLEQPHTSAGRVPSHLGYRKYIDSLMTSQPLTKEEKSEIDSLFNVQNPDPDKLLEDAADALSDYAGTAAVASSITPTNVRVKRVELIAATANTVVILLIASSGLIRNKVCRVNFMVTSELLDFFNKYANSRLAGRSISSISSSYISSMTVSLGEYGGIFTDILFAIYELCREISEGQYYVSGGTKLLTEGELSRSERDLLVMLEQRDQLEALFGSAAPHLQILIGKENLFMELAGSSLIMTDYSIGGEKAGSIGVIGPVRLDYARVIPHLEYFAKTLGSLLDDMFNIEEA